VSGEAVSSDRESGKRPSSGPGARVLWPMPGWWLGGGCRRAPGLVCNIRWRRGGWPRGRAASLTCSATASGWT